MAYKEIRKPDSFTDHATQSTNPDRAWDKCGRAASIVLWSVTNISVDATPSITWHTWQDPIEPAFYAVDLYLMWMTSLQTGDDEFGIEYTNDGGLIWRELVAMGANRSDAWVTEIVELDKNQDLSKIEIRVNTKLVSGADNINLYIADIWTAASFTSPVIVTLQKDLSLETPSLTWINKVAGLTAFSGIIGEFGRGQIWRTDDIGETWTFAQELWDGLTARGGDLNDLIRMTDTIALCATGQKGEIWKSVDSGKTWVSQKYFDPGPSDIDALARLSDTVALAIGSDLITYKSIDAGSTWTEEDTTDLFGSGSTAVLSMEPINSTSAICTCEQSGKVFKTVDSGANWTVILDLYALDEIDDVAGSCVVNNNIYLVGTLLGGQIWRTENGGDDWTKVLDTAMDYCPPQNSARAIHHMGSGVVVAGTASWAQIWWSRDFGITWRRIAQLADVDAGTGNVYSIGQMGNTMFVGTAGRGQIWQSILPILKGNQGGNPAAGLVNQGFGGFGF